MGHLSVGSGAAPDPRNRGPGLPAPALDGAEPAVLHAMGLRALDRGELQEASELLSAAVAARPDHPVWLADHGTVLARLGERDEAISLFRRSLARHPSPHTVRMALGRALLEVGRHEEAVVVYTAVLGSFPADAAARCGLGRALAGVGRLQDAHRHLRVSVRLNGSLPEPLLALGEVSAELGKADTAFRCFVKASRLQSGGAAARVGLGWAQLEFDMLDEATDNFDRALRAHPGAADAVAGLASVLERRGASEDAYTLLRPYATPTPASAHIGLVLAAVERSRGNGDAAARAAEHTVARWLPVGRRAQLHFLLGDLAHERGEAARAFASWTHGNTLNPHHFDAETWREVVDSLIRWFGPGRVDSDAGAASEVEPVFIVGLPGAGGEHLERVLAALPDVHGGGSRTDLDEYAAGLPARLGLTCPECMDRLVFARPKEFVARYVAVTGAGVMGRRYLTDCNPVNARHIGLAATLFRRARVIHVVRDLRDAGLAAFSRREPRPGMAFTRSIQDYADYALHHRRLMRHWQQVLPTPMLELRYEDLVGEPGWAMRQVLGFLGLEADTAGMIPLLEDSATRDPVGRWQRYARWLDPLADLGSR